MGKPESVAKRRVPVPALRDDELGRAELELRAPPATVRTIRLARYDRSYLLSHNDALEVVGSEQLKDDDRHFIIHA